MGKALSRIVRGFGDLPKVSSGPSHNQMRLRSGLPVSARYSWMSAIDMLPSPTALATRLIEP
jgi:hypothetical protein